MAGRHPGAKRSLEIISIKETEDVDNKRDKNKSYI